MSALPRRTTTDQIPAPVRTLTPEGPAPGGHRGLTPLSSDRLEQMKLAYSTARVPLAAMRSVDRSATAAGTAPQSGDLVLARVDKLGHHKRLELRNGWRAQMLEGDDVIVCYGNRYAPDQFEAEVPADLGPCDLVAAGGIASRMLELHSEVSAPTRITPVGLICDQRGRRVNLEAWALPELDEPPARPPTYAVVGSVMNSGKTTTAANLIRGLATAGHRVGACKVTGTGAGGDVWLMVDSGAEQVLDFTDAGLASTYLAPPERVERTFSLLTRHLAAGGAEVIVVEVADGVFQRETATLLGSRVFQQGVDGFLFASNDALGAASGVEALKRLGLGVLGVSGVLTASPLGIREACAATDVPILDIAGLRDVSRLEGCGIEPRRAVSVSRTAHVTDRASELAALDAVAGNIAQRAAAPARGSSS